MEVGHPAFLDDILGDGTDSRRSDLHSRNLLLRHPSLSSKSIEELYQRVNKPPRLPVTHFDKQPPGSQAPRYCVPPIDIYVDADDVTWPHVIIADFGEAFICEVDSRTDVKLRTPTILLPPEAIFNEGVNQGADTWTAANTLYETIGEGPLLDGWYPDKDHVVAEMISTLGQETLPKHWWDSWGAQRAYFLPDGNWDTETEKVHEPRYRLLAERVQNLRRRDDSGSFRSHELKTIEDLLRKMLKYDPADRITAEEAVKSDWMTQYGLPAIANPNSGPPVL